MKRIELEDQAAFAHRVLGEIEVHIARLRESADNGKRRDVVANTSDIILLELLQQMRVIHALHLQHVTEELQKPGRVTTAAFVHGIITAGRVAANLIEAIPTRVPD